MAINEAVIRRVRYSPELIPDSWYGNVPNLGEFAPPILDLKRLSPYIAELVNIQTTQPAGYANVDLRARYDDTRVDENVAAFLPALAGAWKLVAKGILYFNFYGNALVNNYTTHYGVWSYLPTIAHKLLHNIKLTNDEQAICDELGIKNTVEKGLLPLPIKSQIEREYHVVGEETRTRNINIAVANVVYTIDTIYPRPNDEFIVLTRLAAAPGGVGDVVTIFVDRDNDANFAQVFTYPLSLVAGGEVACFVPAMTEIRLTTSDATGAGGHLFRYTIQRIKLNNILRVRFGLVSRDEVPKDLYDKVLAGVL